MKKLDSKHLAFHVLIALYFIWLGLYAILIGMALHNSFGGHNTELDKIFMIWIFLNLLMGTALFVVIRLFNNKTLLNRLVLYSYCIMGAASIITVLLIRINA